MEQSDGRAPLLKLVAATMIGTGERDRYLPLTILALLEFCDEVRVLDESTDGSGELAARLGALRTGNTPGAFFGHEGRARQALLDWTLAAEPSHIVSVDADEFISDGKQLRRSCETSVCPVLTLELQEVWKASPSALSVRTDGGWRPHNAPLCFKVPSRLDATWRIRDRALACGREPEAVKELVRRQCWEVSETQLLHFGWTNISERSARYERYRVADGGRFHAGSHLQSIMLPDSRVTLQERPWPVGMPKADLLRRVNG